MPKLSVIISTYYNEGNIPLTVPVLLATEKLFPPDVTVEYVLVEDGSRDNTYAELLKFQQLVPDRVTVIKLAANVGSHNAVVAGMAHATGDCAVIIAADLQDPPEMMVQLYENWAKGFKLVLANRLDREESFGQKLFSNSFHWLMQKLALRNLPNGGFDYVLFDRVVYQEILRMRERNTHVLYLMLWMGFPYVNIPYVRRKREVGTSRWTLAKKVKLLVDSFISFSDFPVRGISVAGLVLGAVAVFWGIAILLARISGRIHVPGWSALIVVVLFVSAFQMVALGIIGEYVWRALDAARKRPLYVEDEVHPAAAP